MSWSEKYKQSIDCDNPKGFSQKAYCQGRKKRLKEQLKPFRTVEQIAKKHRLEVSFIQKQLDMGEPIEHEHTQNHELAKKIALQHLDEIPDYYTRLKKMETSAKKEHKKFKDVKMNEEGLRAWFGKSKSKEGKPGWVNVVTGGTCASDEPGEGVPKCVSSTKRASMSKEERLSAARRKKKADSGQQQKTGAAKPTYVSTDPKKKMKEEMDLQEVKDKPGKGSGKKDACYHKVKSRYSVWPSAYASGALVKCRKVGADNWGTKSEQVDMIRYCPKCKKDETRDECKYGQKYWDMYSLPSNLGKKYTPNTPHPGNMPEGYDHEYSMARSELSTIISAAKRLKKKVGKGEGSIEAWVQSKITKAADYLDSAADYVDSGEMKAESIERGPILPKEKGKRVFPKGQEPKATGAKLPRINKESVSIEDANGNHYVEFIDIIKPKPLKPSVGIGSRMLDEAGKKCWKGYKKAGTQKLFGKTYNRCVKEGKTFDQFMVEASPAWQRKEGKSPSGGLNAAGRASAKAQGHNLKPPVTTPPSKLKAGSKSANRRKSFCARMGGMPGPMKDEKGRPTRKALSLRKWNC